MESGWIEVLNRNEVDEGSGEVLSLQISLKNQVPYFPQLDSGLLSEPLGKSKE